jgi:hypothetical protein
MAQTKIKAGLFEGIIGNGTDGYFLMSNGDGTMTWSSIIINPTITSIAYPGSVTAADPAGGETITVTGTGFKTGATVTIGGTAAPAVSYVSETQITFTTPAKAAGDYDIVVTNTDTGSATFINGISYNGIPTWTTAAGSLGTFASSTTISTITLQATEPDAGTITFSITNGALPTGLSLTGANIDGTTTLETADTLYTFTVTATDDESQATPRTFTITVTKQFISTDNFTINTYTGNGSTQSIEGKIGTAADFNGSSSNFYINGSEVIDFTSKNYTISFFANLSSNAADQVLVGSWNATTRRFQFATTASNRFIIYERDSSSATQTHALNFVYSTNTWYHISIIRNSTQILFYVNGNLEQTVSANYNIYSSGSNNLWFGKQENSTAPASCYNGKLDQIRLFNKVLSSSEVTTLYGENNASSTKSTTDIFDDGSGIALYEFEEGAKDTGGVTGYIGSGGIFNGSSSKIVLPISTFSPSTFTISAWCNVSSDTDENTILELFDNQTYPNHTTIVFSAGSTSSSARFLLRNYATNQYDYNPSGTVTKNVWKHYAMTYDGSTVKSYIDGSLVDSGSLTLSNTVGTISSIQLGLSSGTRYLNGKIDQVRIFNKAISSSEVTTLYGETSASATKSTTDIFGDGSAVALYELEGNANDTGNEFNVSEEYARADMPIVTDAYFDGTASSGQTISFWFKSDTSANTDTILGSNTVRNGASYGSSILLGHSTSTYADESISFWDYDGSTTSVIQVRNGHNAYKDGTYRHFAMVSTPTTKAIYINGVSQTLTYQQSGSATANFKLTDIIIGDSEGSTSPAPTGVKELRIFGDALTSAEVGYLYNENASQIALLDNKITYSTNYSGTATNVSYGYDGTPTNVSFVGTSFEPDFVWIKNRDAAQQHGLFDSVRGADKWLHSETNQAEQTYGGGYGITSFDSNGFTIGNGTAINATNESIVAWCWKAGGTAVSNTDGSVTSSVSANQGAGFSIVKYTGTLTSAGTISVGHGLSSAPELIISKRTDSTGNWRIRPFFLNNNPYDYLEFDTGALAQFNASDGTMSLPTSTTFDNSWNSALGGAGDVIAYCFHSVDGYQKVGSYSGTGASGNVVTTGFQPRFVMMKAYSTTSDWFIIDSTRSTSDPRVANLRPNNTNTEANASSGLNFTSTGFTFTGAAFNDSGVDWIYLAIA